MIKNKGVQVADAIAYILRRLVRKCAGINPDAFMHQYVSKYINKISGLFYVAKWTPKDMIKFFPGSYNIPVDFWNTFKQ